MNVSILIITYNHEKYIEECLESVFYQIKEYNKDRKHFVQIVVADDCSKDSTRDIVRKWYKKRSDLIDCFNLAESSNNEGTCRNYVKGLRVCTGDYIKVIGGDDLFGKTSIFDIFEELNNYDIVYGLPFIYIEGGTNKIDSINDELKETHFIYSEETRISYYDLIHRYDFFNAPGTFVRKDLLLNESVIQMVLNYKYVEDYPMYLKLSEIKDIRIKYQPHILVIYRRTNDSTYIRVNKILRDELINIFKYARNTSHRIREKLIQTSSIYMQKKEKPIKYFDLLTYIHKYYMYKHRKDNSIDFRDDVEKHLIYIDEIKKNVSLNS